MKFDLKQVFNIVEDSKDLDHQITADQLSDIRGLDLATPISIKGRVYNQAGVVYLEYTASFTLDHTCDRCLKDFQREYQLSFDHIVVPSLSGDNDDYIVADGECIEMNDIAVTDILLQLPVKILCKEDCKGLCMVCGCDLNQCTCEHIN
ncbi:MAG TPA: DUF177 domain-containing protein [Ruminococcus sp.]|nr:DUF177 domain-containing protein [Ruminococcus sp.]